MMVQITKYKVTCWLDKKRCEPVYGVKVFVTDTGWCDVADDCEPVFHKTEQEARAYITSMKKERDRSGYKIAETA